MSSPVKGNTGAQAETFGTLHTDANDELALIQQARQYSDQERKKTLKWFVSRGEPIPTKKEVSEIYDEREGFSAIRAALQRDVDRRRAVTELGKFAEVPINEHPGFSAEAANLSAPQFNVTAASGIESRRRLHDTFSSLCWTILVRQRVEARLARLSAKRAETMAPAISPQLIAPQTKSQTGAALSERPPPKEGQPGPRSRRHKSAQPVPVDAAARLCFLEMQSLVPDSEGEKPPPSHRTKSSAASNSTAQFFPEAPSTTAVEVLKPKELRTPFEFKIKDYKLQKFTEHPFAACDPPEVIAQLPAGPREVTEANSHAPIPLLTNFTPPVVTMETFPMLEFPFMRTDPKRRLIQGTAAQPVTNCGFKEPFITPDHGQQIPSIHFCIGLATKQVFRDPLPKPLRQANPDDQLSDSDDENAELRPRHPTSLVDLAATFLPPFRVARPTTQHQSPQHSQQGHSASQAGVGSTVGQQQVEKVAPDHILEFTPNPIHSMANEKTNRSAAGRRAQCEEWRQQTAKTLPQHLQLQF